jgi:hypothetical protein
MRMDTAGMLEEIRRQQRRITGLQEECDRLVAALERIIEDDRSPDYLPKRIAQEVLKVKS